MRADGAMVRAGLILTATGIVSAATVHYALDQGVGEAAFGLGFLLYLGLIVLATPRRPFRAASPLALACFAAIYLAGALTRGANDLGLAAYVTGGAVAYLATAPRFRTLTVAAFAMWTPALRLLGPDPLVGSFPVWLGVASVLSLLFPILTLLVRDATDDDERLRRIGLGLLAVACLARIDQRHLVVASPGATAPDDVWALAVVAVLPLLAIVRTRRGDALAIGVAAGAYVLSSLALLLGKGYHVDSVAVVHRATDLFLAGRNPYRDLDVTEALSHFGLDPSLATNFSDGTALHAYNYPALSFLVPAPFVALGLQDVRYLYLLEVVVLLLVVVRRVRLPWRPLIAAAVVGNAVIARQNVLAGVDPFWAAATLFAFLSLRHRSWSPILMGLAIAARQPAWFFAPFYVLAVWKGAGSRAAIRAAALTLAIAALPNLPFLVMDPATFVGGVTQPLVEALEPYGVGLVRFSMDGYVPLLPRAVYALLSVASLTGSLVLLARRWRGFPAGVLVFPSVVLWFAWRSLQNYFSFAGVFALAGDEDAVPREG